MLCAAVSLRDHTERVEAIATMAYEELSRFTYNHLIVSGIGDYLSSLVAWTLAMFMGKSPETIGGELGTYHIDQLFARN